MALQVSGNLHVSNDVIADIAGKAAMECYGIVGMSSPSLQDGIATLLPATRRRRGIQVTSSEAGIHVDVYVILEYGTNIGTVSQNLIDNITYTLDTYVQVQLDGIDVHVQGVKVRK